MPPEPDPSEAGEKVTYRFRRPREADEKPFVWVAETTDGQRVAFGPDPVSFHKWRAVLLSNSLWRREHCGDSRDAIARILLDLPFRP